MDYPTPRQLQFPITPYKLSPEYLQFGQKIRRHWILWATHLGDDIVVDAGTPVVAIGEGQVVWSQMRHGQANHRNWGGVVVIGHTHVGSGQPFYSVYGHMKDLQVQTGDRVISQQQLGIVAPGYTPENGWWKIPHLHFAIYTGPWRNEIVPGYKRPEEWRTKLRWWHNPQSFITTYNQEALAA